jgi:lipopolysaccharide assembly outer membrane protein LptD (OstA)
MPLLLQATLLAQEPGRSVTTGKSLPDTLLMTLPDTVVKSDSATVLMTLPDTVVKSDSGALSKTLPDTLVKSDSGTILKSLPDTLVKSDSGTILKSLPDTSVKSDSGALSKTLPDTLVKSDSGALPKTLPDTVVRSDSGTILKSLPDTLVKSDSGTLPKTLPDTSVKSDSGTLPKTLPDTVVTGLNEEDLSPAFVNDTLFPGTSGTITDTSLTKTGLIISSDAVDEPIVYNSDGYMKTDMRSKKVSLVENARVTYGTIQLTADSIVLDMETGSVFATFRRDSTGKAVGLPVYKDGSEEFESEELNYNFKSKKGVIRNVTTEQEGGFLQSLTTKRHDDGTLHVNRSKFTTCDADEPHFYLSLPRAKVYPGEKIVSGPAYMVVADIPLPLVLPFGFFPVQQKRASGIVMPKYGQEARRGYFLSNGGYYFALSDYFDLKLTGTLYTNGTWLADAATSYRLRYRFSGSFSFSYANNVTSYKGLPDYGKNTNYRISWSHSQDAKANPGSRFSASVNMSSSGYDKNNSYEVADHVTTTRQSSISYSKTWSGAPVSFSTSINQSQNVQNKTMMLNLPRGSLNVSRIYPFKPKKLVGKSKWYHDITTQYTASFENKINTYDSLLFTSAVWKSMQNGFKHEIPLSLQFRPFNNFSISPSLRYTGVLYTQQIHKRWDPDYYDERRNMVVPSVVNDTVRGVTYGHALVPTVSASFNPSIYGTFAFTKKGSGIEAIRHVMKPSVSFSYSPEADKLSSDMYRTVQYDTVGRMRTYSIYEGSVFGTPSTGNRSGSVAFSLSNIVEAKVYSRNDTTGKPRKIKLIDNLSLNTSYNLFSDSLNWSPVNISFRTTLAQNINIQASSSFSIYGMNATGGAVNELAIRQGLGLARMTGFNMSFDLDLGQLLGNKNKKQQSGGQGGQMSTGRQPGGPGAQGGAAPDNLPLSNRNLDEFGYVRFDVPWSLRMAYNFSYSKPGLRTNISQAMTMSGDLKLTPKMALTYNTGYDFRQKEITMTRVGISRDLHCWEMSFSWIPTGYMKSWNFTIRAKASMLQDLKYERRKDYHENY